LNRHLKAKRPTKRQEIKRKKTRKEKLKVMKIILVFYRTQKT